MLIHIECRADVKFVDFKKIDPTGQYATQQRFLLDYLAYFDHWSPDWVYEPPKDSLINALKGCLTVYEPLKASVYETDLLLGEVAHYLYNLDEKSYYDTAEHYYLDAVALDKKDCRGFWFLGYHYATSDEVKKGVVWFNKAYKLVNNETGNDFWQEYAFTMELAAMPAHCRYALDKYIGNGGTSTLSKVMDSTLRAETIQADPDITYKNRTLWTKDVQGKMMSFTSTPLGIQLRLDTIWDMELYDYTNRITAVSVKPPILKSVKGATIGYTIGVIVHPAKEGEELQDFVTSMMKMNGTKDASFPFADRYPKGISYTVRTKDTYADRGAAHIHFIAIERDYPLHPGLALEDEPLEMKSEPGKLEFFKLGLTRTRFPGRIFYLFVLDTCEDIHEGSWDAFQQFIANMKLD
jgi:hypothetical protein